MMMGYKAAFYISVDNSTSLGLALGFLKKIMFITEKEEMLHFPLVTEGTFLQWYVSVSVCVSLLGNM